MTVNTLPAPPFPQALTAMFARYVPTQHLASADVLADVARRWCERQRHWHGPKHIMDMLPKAAQLAEGDDLEAELRHARFLDDLRPGTAVVWISCEPQFQHLSSSAMRELAAIKPGAESRYIPTATQIYGLCDEVPPSVHAPA